MTKFIYAVIIVLLCGILSAANIDESCGEFVKSPNRTSYKNCNSLLFLQDNGRDRVQKLIEDDVFFKKLLSIIRKRNEFALRLGMSLFCFSDGSKKEDLGIELGNTLNHNPRLLLLLFVRNRFSDDDIRSVLLNYSENYVDDFEKVHIETNNRINKISALNERGLTEIKTKCLNILQRFKQDTLKVYESVNETE